MDYIKRMENEYAELDEKARKLETFIIDSEIYQNMQKVDKNLLAIQLNAMNTYLNILSTRIDREKENLQ